MTVVAAIFFALALLLCIGGWVLCKQAERLLNECNESLAESERIAANVREALR